MASWPGDISRCRASPIRCRSRSLPRLHLLEAPGERSTSQGMKPARTPWQGPKFHCIKIFAVRPARLRGVTACHHTSAQVNAVALVRSSGDRARFDRGRRAHSGTNGTWTLRHPDRAKTLRQTNIAQTPRITHSDARAMSCTGRLSDTCRAAQIETLRLLRVMSGQLQPTLPWMIYAWRLPRGGL